MLFDYDTKEYIKNSLSIKSSGYLIKKKNKIFYSSKRDDLDLDEYIATIRKNGDEIFINSEEEQLNPKFEKNLDDNLWIVVRNTKFKDDLGYRLREGDKIKLGKIIFKVCELYYEFKNNSFDNPPRDKSTFYVPVKKNINDANNNLNNNNNENVSQNGKSAKPKFSSMCRICLMDENEDENPLISPCKCIGSVRFVHLICMRKWLNAKTIVKNIKNMTVYTFKNFECELCKTSIPERLKFRDENIILMDYERPEGNYVILESISRESKENKYLYIIQVDENDKLRMGRSSEADIKVADISVSRNHAILSINKGDFYIQDNLSKFGTLIQLQNEIMIFPKKPIAIQTGKIQMIFSIGRSCLSFIKCYKNRKLLNIDYNEFLNNRIPIYYQQELENVNTLNTNYSVNSNEAKSIKNTKPKEEIVTKNEQSNKNIENNVKSPSMILLHNNNDDDMTTNRLNESEPDSIMNKGSSRNLIDHSSILNNVTANNIIQSNSLKLIKKPMRERRRINNQGEYRENLRNKELTSNLRENREDTNLLGAYRRQDISNVSNERAVLKINYDNINNKNFYSEKSKKIISENFNSKSSKNKKYQANSLKSKDNIEEVSLKEQEMYSSLNLENLSQLEFNFDHARENLPYSNNFKTRKQVLDPKYTTINLNFESNTFNKVGYRMDTFNPEQIKKFGTHTNNSLKEKENPIPISEFKEGLDNLDISKFNESQQIQFDDDKLFNSVYKMFKIENFEDDTSIISKKNKIIKNEPNTNTLMRESSSKNLLLNDSDNNLIDQTPIANQIESKSKDNKVNSKYDGEKESNEINKLNIVNDMKYEMFRQNYENLQNINIIFNSNIEEPKSFCEESLSEIRQFNKNHQYANSMSNSDFKTIKVHPSENLPINAFNTNT